MRLSGKHEYTALFQRGARSADRCFTLLGRANGLDHGRLGLAISRKAARRATSRNRLKRLAREAFRHHQQALAGFDVVVMARPGAERLAPPELRASLDRLYTQMPERCDPSSRT